MTHAKQFDERLFTELHFDARHLSPLRRLYRHMLGNCLGAGFSFREAPGLHPKMTWHYASSPRTLAAFRHCLTSSDLRESLSIVHGDSQLLAACFVVVRGDTPSMDFHVDYGERAIPAGVTGTMLTPLLALDAQFGHLDYREGRGQFEYRYQLGKAILFDGKFEHRSQAANSVGPGTRTLVSWSIATNDAQYRFAIGRIIDSQTK
ncbi:MAG: hypothetical protein R3F49_10205 [Planctomycetota bacterium]